MEPRRVLVTGAGGFIGHHLVKRLKAEKNYVVGADWKEPEFERTAADDFILRDLKTPPRDLNTPDSVESVSLTTPSTIEICRDCEIQDIYALAANMGGMGFISKDHARIMYDNVQLNLNALMAARHTFCVERLFFSSSACVYPVHAQHNAAHSGNLVALREDMAFPAQPDQGYGWEKLFTEILLQYASKEWTNSHHGKPLWIRIARFHNIYGPLGAWRGGREKAPAAICRKVAEAKLTGQKSIEIWGDGLQARSFCFIGDCLEGIRRLMESDVQQPVNIGSSEVVSINRLVNMIAEIAGLTGYNVIHVEGPQGVRGRNSDNTLCREKLHWEPSVCLREGLEVTYPWIEDQVRERLNRAPAGGSRPSAS